MLKQSLFHRPVKVDLPSVHESADSAASVVTSMNVSSFNDVKTLQEEKKVLNVGGSSKEITIPEHYNGWSHHLLDIDPAGNPDVVCDARTLVGLPACIYDSVYCSHNLEHYYSHDVIKVLRGFHHVLKNDGFVDIAVPDMQAVVKHMVQENMDIDDVLYESPTGPITITDVMYGYGKQIEQSGQDFYAHKTGFSENSLIAVLNQCGFMKVYCLLGHFEIRVIGFKQLPNQHLLAMLNLPLQKDDEAVKK